MTWEDRTRLLLLLFVLGTIAALAPVPSYSTDADLYERIGREWFIRGCDELHCSRVLVPWLLGLLPGASLIKWKTLAVLCETGAAWLMARWVLRLGATPRAANQVMWLTALGSGSLYTFFDPHTADPLMHLAAPALLLLLFDSRASAAIGLAAIAVFAKELAAVPLLVAGLTWFQQRRWAEMRRAWLGVVVVVAIWATWTIWLRTTWGYNYGKNQSANLLGGGFLFFWMARLPVSVIVGSIVMTLGVLWILWPAGLLWGPRQLRQLTWATLPCILLWCYVQQPDRALWNFVFAVMPAAAVVLARVGSTLGWSLVAVHALVNLRFGAQLAFVPPAKYSLILGGVLALVAVWQVATMEQRRLSPGATSSSASENSPRVSQLWP